MNNSVCAEASSPEAETVAFDEVDQLPKIVRDEMNYAVGSFTIGSVKDALFKAWQANHNMSAAAIHVAILIREADEQDVTEFAAQFERITGTPYPHTAADVSILRKTQP